MSDLGQTFHVLAVRFERTLPGPVERVWQHLTECDKLSGWFGADGVLEPRGAYMKRNAARYGVDLNNLQR